MVFQANLASATFFTERERVFRGTDNRPGEPFGITVNSVKLRTTRYTLEERQKDTTREGVLVVSFLVYLTAYVSVKRQGVDNNKIRRES